MDFRIFTEYWRGQNLLDWNLLYIIEKFLQLRCFKWARITRLDIWNTSYGQMKGRESNWLFDSSPLKVKNWPNFLVCRCCATYCWKAFDKGYNFVLDLISVGSLYTKLWGPKVVRVLWQNVIWMWASWRDTYYIIKGKVVVCPKFGPWWILWVQVCLWHVLAPKVLKLCTNQLFVWFVQICVSD
jgi:hypothetical protein